jgi:hypothetical protein
MYDMSWLSSYSPYSIRAIHSRTIIEGRKKRVGSGECGVRGKVRVVRGRVERREEERREEKRKGKKRKEEDMTGEKRRKE